MSTTYETLLFAKADIDAKAAELEKQIEAARRLERADAVTAIHAQMAQHGVTLQDLGAPAAKSSRKARKPREAGEGNPTKGTKVAAKYIDGHGHTWSGRGLQPVWLREAIAGGRKLEDFKVSA